MRNSSGVACFRERGKVLLASGAKAAYADSMPVSRKKAKARKPRWCVYLLRLRNGALYCGITNDLPRRLMQHNSGQGAKCIVPSQRPAVLVYREPARGKSAALRREYAIKQLTKRRKEALVRGAALLHAKPKRR